MLAMPALSNIVAHLSIYNLFKRFHLFNTFIYYVERNFESLNRMFLIIRQFERNFQSMENYMPHTWPDDMHRIIISF
jgi:hypothetical protein